MHARPGFVALDADCEEGAVLVQTVASVGIVTAMAAPALAIDPAASARAG